MSRIREKSSPFAMAMRDLLTRDRDDGQKAAQYATRHGVGHICQRMTAMENSAREKRWRDNPFSRAERLVEAEAQHATTDDLHAEALYRNRMTRYTRMQAERIDRGEQPLPPPWIES